MLRAIERELGKIQKSIYLRLASRFLGEIGKGSFSNRSEA